MKKSLSQNESSSLIAILKKRFEAHPERHPHIKWLEVEKQLMNNAAALTALQKMEDSEGEPDVVQFNKKNTTLLFCDCASESPKGRRSLCFDEAALISRKEHKPKSSVEAVAEEMGVRLLNEEEYRQLQTLGDFDSKTSSWIETPAKIRKLGGALFGDKRYETVFIYHNGAESYYAARGFRALLEVK